jgi:hypothetical protein
MHIDSGFGYQRDPDWHYGNMLQRQALLERLLDHARGAVPSVPGEDRSLYARAAIALATQEAPIFGYGTLRSLLDAPRVRELAGISEAGIANVRVGIEQHTETSRAFARNLVRAKRALTTAPGSGTSTRAIANEINEALRAMAPLSRERPDLQWHLATVTWQFVGRAGKNASPLVAELKAAVNSSLFDRWMAESATLAPPAPLAPVPITHAELESFRNQTKALRDRLSASPPDPSP